MHLRLSKIFLMVLFASVACPDVFPARTPDQTPNQNSTRSSSQTSVDIPAGTTVEVALVRPLLSRAAAPGAAIYAQVVFPVTAKGRIAIPPGTYVQGRLEKLIRPTRHSPRAEFDIAFTRLIFADGYVAPLPGAAVAVTADHAAETLIAVAVQVTANNDVLLDNGDQIEITLGSQLALDGEKVAAAIPVSHAPSPNEFKTASLCRPVAGTPGTSDTVIPGSAGTPDTVIPGGPGMPDTVIPGTPATPDTVIPGISGSPGIRCPAPPVVLSSAPVPPIHTAAIDATAHR